MKLLCLFSLVVGSLLAQIEPGQVQQVLLGSHKVDHKPIETELRYEVRLVNGTKVIFFDVENCTYPSWDYDLHNLDGFFYLASPVCKQVDQSEAEMYSAVQAVLSAFFSQYPDGVQWYTPIPADAKPRPAGRADPDLATVQPLAPPNPQMIFLDGLSYNLLEVDMTTFATTSLVTLPPQATVFGVRPPATPPANEVWTAHGGTFNEISIADLATQSVVATIPTSSLNPNNSLPVGIVFTRSGATALYAVSYYAADSSGNNGVLLVFDPAARTLTSTLPLKYAPTALLMAPDGLTAYLLSSGGMITYYDVLSGTADLSASTYPAGSNAGYPGTSSAVYIHPDGTRLFWVVGGNLVVFDLTARTVTNQFSSGIPTTVSQTFSLSQDGWRAYFSDQQGDVAIIDTLNGNILATSNTGSGTAVFGGPPLAP
jgi:hypothetical protein